MKIKEIKNQREIEYPYLGEFTYGTIRIVVMFTSPREGIVIKSSDWSMHKEGEYFNDWQEDIFEWYNGVIELAND